MRRRSKFSMNGLLGVTALGVAILSIGGVLAAAGQEPEAAGQEAPGVLLTGAEPFRDDFSARAGQRWSVSDGWRVGDWMLNDWRGSQTKFGEGLTLTLAPKTTELAEFSSGEIQSRQKYGHGYYEAKLRAASGSGVVTGFFTYTGPHYGDEWDEIDVEIIGRKPREVMFTYFRNGKKKSHFHQLDYDATQESHTYGFDWQPGFIRWYVDGEMVHQSDGAELPLPHLQQRLMASLWGSDSLRDWLGPFDNAALPTQAVLSCVSYSRSFATRQSCD